MKTILLTFTLLCFLGTNTDLQAQGILESIQKTAKMENERDGRQSNDSGSEQGNGNQGNLSNSDAQAMESLFNYLDIKLGHYLPLLEELDNPNLNCFALMLIFLDSYSKLEQKAHAVPRSACQKKYDMYGMLMLANTSSNTIMYCPEGLNELTDEQLIAADRELNIKIFNLGDQHPNPAYRDLYEMYDLWIGNDGIFRLVDQDIGNETPGPEQGYTGSEVRALRLFIEFFSPQRFI
ncbi:MAG: hypothetical protein HKN48_06130, partial [Flavobacteriaceae bacterium]|nr:hypothetical protein [Flavobacteriaceae bacterium]